MSTISHTTSTEPFVPLVNESIVDTFLDRGVMTALVYDLQDDSIHIYRGAICIAHTHENHDLLRRVYYKLKREARTREG